MKTRILMAFVLAGGMALAQSGSNPGSTDQNQPSQGGQAQPSAQDQQQPASPSTQDQQQQPASPSTQDQQQPASPSTQDQQQPAPPSSTPDQSPSAATGTANTQETVLRGCLKQSAGNWVISQNGQDTTLNGDDSMFKPHDGQQVEVHGTQSSGGALQVTAVNTISDSCSGGNDTASATAAGAAATSTATDESAAAASQAPPSAANPDQSAASAQNAPPVDANTPLHPNQTPEDRRQIAENVSKLPNGEPSLPQTASPLPLLGLLGLGSLVTGVVVRKKK